LNKANFRPNPINKTPATLFNMTVANGLARTRSAK
jgi:hypothetical protein